MTLFNFFRRSQTQNSAQTAKERLQILLAHERQDRSRPDYLPLMQREILEVIRKYTQVPSEKIEIKLQRGDPISTLEIEVELPEPRESKAQLPAPAPNSAFAR